MKQFIKKSLGLSAIIIATVFGMSWCLFGYTQEIGLIFKLIFLSFAIVLIQYFIAKLSFKYYLINMLMEYLCICIVVLLFGILNLWFFPSNCLMVFLYVGIVYVFAFCLDMIAVKRDVDYINKKLENRRKNSENKL